MDKIETKEAASPPRRLSKRAQRELALRQQAEAARKVQQAQRRRVWLAGLVFVACLVAFVVMVSLRPKLPAPAPAPASAAASPPPAAPSVSTPAASPPVTNLGYPTLAELVAMTPEELGKVDVAVVNLRCAEGLPGAEKIDIAAALQKIDGWTARIKEQTDAYAAKLARHPERYGGVLGKYQMDMLTTVLQQDEGVHYDPAMIDIQEKKLEDTPDDTFYDDARHLFVNGLTERQSGTCASMPVFYAAIARRLGYPVRLAQTNGHLYLQWLNDDGSHFNVEATAKGGLMEHPDDYYWHWPRPVSPAQAEKYHFFEPLNARDELATFLNDRAMVLMTSGNMTGSIRCQAQAQQVAEKTKAQMDGMMFVLQVAMHNRQLDQLDALLEQRDRQQGTLQPAWPSLTGTPKP